MRRGLIRTVLAIGVLLALVLIYPLLNENTGNSCSAFEKIALRESIRHEVDHGRLSSADAPVISLFGRSLEEASHGAFTAELIKNKHPNLPPFVGCTVEYYDLLFHPSKFDQALN